MLLFSQRRKLAAQVERRFVRAERKLNRPEDPHAVTILRCASTVIAELQAMGWLRETPIPRKRKRNSMTEGREVKASKALTINIDLTDDTRVSVRGYLPFTHFGQRFAVTRHLDRERGAWRATHVETGIAIPGVSLGKKESVESAAKAVLDHVGRAKFLRVLAKEEKRAKGAAASAQDGKKEERTP